MPETIDVRRVRVRRLDELVVVVVLGELPVVDFVDRGATDLYRAAFAERDPPLVDG